MAAWDGWDIGILLVVAFIAVTTLVRLMTRRREKLLDDLSRDVTSAPVRKPKLADQTAPRGK